MSKATARIEFTVLETHKCTDRGPILTECGLGTVTPWLKCTHAHTHAGTHTGTHGLKRRRRNTAGGEKQEQKVKSCQDVAVRRTKAEQKPKQKQHISLIRQDKI